MMSFTFAAPSRALLAAVVLMAAPECLAQGGQEQSVGYGVLKRSFNASQLVGDGQIRGVAAIEGLLYISGADGVQHRIYVVDPASTTLLGSFLVPEPHKSSALGALDLAKDNDGNILAGGAEGVAVFDRSGNALRHIVGNAGSVSLPLDGNGHPVVGNQRGALDQIDAGGKSEFTGVAFDPNGDGGVGSLIVAQGLDAGDYLELRISDASVLRRYDVLPDSNGLAFDPIAGTLWTSASADWNQGLIELDISGATDMDGDGVFEMLETGKELQRPRMDFANPGLGRTYGGLDFMAGGDPGSPRFGTPAWDLVSVSQDDEGRGGDDLIAFHRVHQFPFVSGYDESRLQASSGTDPLVPPPIDPLVGNFPVLYDEMETLNWGVVSNGRPNSGLPAWIIFNFGSDASQDGISALAPGLILAELVSLTPLSTPAPAQPVIIQNTVVDATTTVVLPPFMPVSTGDVIRLQAIYSEPLGPLFLAASNEAWFTGLDVNDVLVELDGSGSPYSRVSELTGDPAKAIAKVVFDFGPGSLLPGDNWVDTDLVQADGSNKIFAAGNGTVPGCMGTYRNGSDIATGLIYAGSDIIDLSENGSDLPPCYTQLQSLDGMGNPIVPITGFTGSNHVDGTNRHPRTIEFNFALGQFKGLTFEFDARIQSTHFVGTGTRSFAGTRVRVERADGSSFEGHLIPEKANSPISLIGW